MVIGLIFYLTSTPVIEFPRIPTGVTKQFIVDEADTRLGLYSFPDETSQSQAQAQNELPAAEKELGKDGKDKEATAESAAPHSVHVPPSAPKLLPHVVDAPLVRLYNFLRELFICVGFF